MQVSSKNSKNGTRKYSKTPQIPAKKNQNRMEFYRRERKEWEESPVSLCWPTHFSQRTAILQREDGRSHPSKVHYQDKVFKILLPMGLPHGSTTDFSVKWNYERNK